MVSSLQVARLAVEIRPLFPVLPHSHARVGGRPFGYQLCAPYYLALEVDREVVNDLDQPRLRVSRRIQFDESNQKRFLDDVAGVLFLEPVFPGRPADEGEKVLSIELVESLRVGQKGGAGVCPRHDRLPLSLHGASFRTKALYLLSRREKRGSGEDGNPSDRDENEAANLPGGEP